MPLRARELTVLAVALFHDLFLGIGGALHAQHGQPCALVVLDVGADFARHLRIAEAIQKVVLHLEEMAHFQENGLSLAEYLGIIVSVKMRKYQ